MTKRLIVFLSFLLLSILLLLPVWSQFPKYYIGHGEDPFIMMWMLKWFAYAIKYHLNPLFCYIVWYPFGVNLTLTTNIPFLSLLAWPVTQLSPLLSYNFMLTLAMPVSAFAMYLLANYFSKNHFIAWCSGLVYGFSTYQYVHLQSGHLNLVWGFCLPLIVLQIVRFYKQEASQGGFLFSFIALQVIQFLISKEVFVLTNFLMAIAFVLLLLVLRHYRKCWLLLKTGCLAYGIVFLIILPFLYLYSMTPIVAYHPSYLFEISLANFVIPTKLTYLGAGLLSHWGKKFGESISENTGYLGIPYLCAILFVVIRYARKPMIFYLALLWLVCVILSFGFDFRIFSKPVLELPIRFLYNLPGVHYALPARFSLFVFLLSSLLLIIFLQSKTLPKIVRGGVMLLIIVFLLPNWHAKWYEKVKTLNVFSGAQIQQLIPYGSRVLVLDQSSNLIGRMMLLQLKTKAKFLLTNGHLGPGAYSYYYAVGFQQPNYVSGSPKFFRFYTKKTKTNIVMVSVDEWPIFKVLFKGVKYYRRELNGVYIFYLQASKSNGLKKSSTA